MPGMADIMSSDTQAGPDWAALFDESGSWRDSDANGVPDFKQLYGGRAAIFASDDISLGAGTDFTALTPDGRIQVGKVEAQHDLGNAYVYAKGGSSGNLILFTGIERIGGGDSFVEFEYNQNVFRLGRGGYGRGEPWQIDGERLAGDLLVRLKFAGGALSDVEVQSWQDGRGWTALEGFSGEGCDSAEMFCAVSNMSSIEGGPWVNHDTGPDAELISAHRFIEFGINVGALLGSQPSYKTVRVRTPQDAIFAYFGEGN